MTIKAGEGGIACEGFCRGSYHMKCVTLSTNEKISCLKNPHVFWICETCSKMLRKIRYSEDMQEKFNSLKMESRDDHPVDIDQTTTKHETVSETIDAITEIKSEIASIQKALANLTASRHTELSTSTNEDPLAHSSPTRPNNSTDSYRCGSRIGVIPGQIGNSSNVTCDDKLWLFFSRVKNNVCEDEIRFMVAECLQINTDEVIVQKLVSNWMDVTQLPYISFKVGVHVNHRDRAMCSSTWPKGVWFREFRERCFTWQPQMR